jgi:hypothetical protein
MHARCAGSETHTHSARRRTDAYAWRDPKSEAHGGVALSLAQSASDAAEAVAVVLALVGRGAVLPAAQALLSPANHRVRPPRPAALGRDLHVSGSRGRRRDDGRGPKKPNDGDAANNPTTQRDPPSTCVPPIRDRRALRALERRQGARHEQLALCRQLVEAVAQCSSVAHEDRGRVIVLRAAAAGAKLAGKSLYPARATPAGTSSSSRASSTGTATASWRSTATQAAPWGRHEGCPESPRSAAASSPTPLARRPRGRGSAGHRRRT